MNDKVKTGISFLLIILAIVFYVISQFNEQNIANLETNLLLIFFAGIFGIAGVIMLGRYLPRIL
jgi:uncharacterized membrane protein